MTGLEPCAIVCSRYAAWPMRPFSTSSLILPEQSSSSRTNLSTVLGSTRLTSRSQKVLRIFCSCAGDCSLTMSLQISLISGRKGCSRSMSFFLENLKHSSWEMASLRLRLHVFMILIRLSSLMSRAWSLIIWVRASLMVSLVGAGILKFRQRDLMGKMSRCTWLQTRIMRHDDIYFYIVLLSEPWASLVSLWASLMTSILNFLEFLELTSLEEAISLTTFCMICLSSHSLSDGVTSI